MNETKSWSLEELNSAAQLRAVAAEWDDLWSRSTTTMPAARAEPLACWLEAFAAGRRLRAVMVRYQGHPVAALPLIVSHRARVVPIAELPRNHWSAAGELLVDCSAESLAEEAVRRLLGACRRGGYAWLNLQWVEARSPAWRLLRRVARQQGALLQQQFTTEVGRIEMAPTWSQYEASRSRNHRQQLRRAARRLERQGEYALRVLRNPDSQALPELLHSGFAVEDRSWKGDQGTSVLRSPGIFEFYLHQAQALAALGHLELVFLEHRGMPIAFEYGWLSDGVYYSPKVGYDPAFARYCPGQLLRWERLQQMHQQGDYRKFDFFGPLSPATERWCTERYRLATLRIAARGVLAPWGKLALSRTAQRPARLPQAGSDARGDAVGVSDSADLGAEQPEATSKAPGAEQSEQPLQAV